MRPRIRNQSRIKVHPDTFDRIQSLGQHARRMTLATFKIQTSAIVRKARPFQNPSRRWIQDLRQQLLTFSILFVDRVAHERVRMTTKRCQPNTRILSVRRVRYISEM